MYKKSRKHGGDRKSHAKITSVKVETVCHKFGRYSLKGALLPDGRFIPDYWEATRILCSLLDMPPDIMDRMPKVAPSPLFAVNVFLAVLHETKDQPETIAFMKWLDSLTQNQKDYTVSTVAAVCRHFGVEVTQDEIFQNLLDSPDTVVVTDGDITRIYTKAGKLIAERRKQ